MILIKILLDCFISINISYFMNNIGSGIFLFTSNNIEYKIQIKYYIIRQ